MDSSYFNWARGNRATAYAGLAMDPGHEFRYAPDYTYIEIPCVGFYDEKEERVVEKGLRNQYLKVVPACSLDVRGTFKVQVEPCMDLAKFGMIQPGYYIHQGSGLVTPDYYVQLRKDTDVTDIPYAVRLYLRG